MIKISKNKKATYRLIAGCFLFLCFLLLTILLNFVDIAPIGPQDTNVGFSSLNRAVFELLGTNDAFAVASEILGYIAFLIAISFAALVGIEWITRKDLLKIDRNLFGLFATYAATAFFYVLFELLVINYRPILEDGALAASYPSSHTLLAVVLFGTAMVQTGYRTKNKILRIVLQGSEGVLLLLTALFRLFSGVHWLTDILGSLMLGSALVLLYDGFCRLKGSGPVAKVRRSNE